MTPLQIMKEGLEKKKLIEAKYDEYMKVIYEYTQELDMLLQQKDEIQKSVQSIVSDPLNANNIANQTDRLAASVDISGNNKEFKYKLTRNMKKSIVTINREIEKIKKKIEEYKKTIQEKIEAQLKAVQEWIDKQTDIINKFIMQQQVQEYVDVIKQYSELLDSVK